MKEIENQLAEIGFSLEQGDTTFYKRENWDSDLTGNTDVILKYKDHVIYNGVFSRGLGHFPGAPKDRGELYDYYPDSPVSLTEVTHSVVIIEAYNGTFDEFCNEYGCDIDSRKAYYTWEVCYKIMQDLERAGVDVEKVMELLGDY